MNCRRFAERHHPQHDYQSLASPLHASTPTHTRPNLLKLLRQLQVHLGRRRRLQLGVLLLMLGSSASEVLSLAVRRFWQFWPILKLWTQPMVQQLAPQMGFTNALMLITLTFGGCIGRGSAAEPLDKELAGGGY